MLSVYAIIDVIIVGLLTVLAVLVSLRGGYKQYVNRLFVVLAIMVAVWIPSNHIANNVDLSVGVALVANYLVFASAFGAMILVMNFVSELASVSLSRKFTKFMTPFLWIIALLAATPLTVAGIEQQGNVYAVIFGPLILLYGAALLMMMGVVFYTLIIGLRKLKGAALNQLQVIALSLMVSLPLVVTMQFILPSLTGIFAFTEFGVSPVLLLVIGIYYSVIRHRLFDLRFVVVRSLVYIGVLATLSVLYYGIAYAASRILFTGSGETAVSPINTFAALLLAFFFQPVKSFFDKITNKFFYRDNYKTDVLYAEMSRLLASTTDLRGLLERAAVKLASTLKSEQGYFFVYHSAGHYLSSGTKNRTYLAIEDARRLEVYVEERGDAVILGDEPEIDTAIKRMMTSYRLAIILPLRHSGGVLGYLCLGEHKGAGYVSRDVRVLETLSDELIVAIQNALSVQEVKEINATLQQRIDVATKELRSSNAQLRHIDEVKDEFISMASHQLRTPLTSIKGYLSMVLEGDMGNVTPQQETVLKEAFNSSERMVRLISDFLNVSRLQTGKFLVEYHPTDLGSVVEQETNSLRLIAEAHNIKLIVKVPKKSLPTIELDEAKVRQVIMNFIDNAIYYSRPETTITVSLEQIDDELAFVVADTGIGVPVEEQAKLFHKFFRATNARKQRPDGTGVGLFLAKKVITAHGGKMIFSSTEGKGSKFGFRIPVDTSKKRTQINEA